MGFLAGSDLFPRGLHTRIAVARHPCVSWAFLFICGHSLGASGFLCMHKIVRRVRRMNVHAKRTPDMRGERWTNVGYTRRTRSVFVVCSSSYVAHTLLVPDTLIFLQEGDHQLLLLLTQLEVLLVLLVFVFARLPNPTAVQVCDTCETRLSTDQNVSVSEYDCTSESREGMMM